MKLTTLTPARSKSARLAVAIVLLASSASSTTVTFVRCIRASSDLDSTSTSIDSTSNSFPLAISTSLPPHVGQRNAGISIAHSCPHGRQRSRASITSCSSRAPSQTRVARDELEVELERVRDHLAQPPDAQVDHASPAARRRAWRRC